MNKIKKYIEKIRLKRYKKLVDKLFPWFDYTSLYSLMGEWLKYASENMLEKGNCAGHDKIAGEMLKAHQLSMHIAKEEAYKKFHEIAMLADVSLEYLGAEERKATQIHQSFLKQLLVILEKESLEWWD